MAGRPPAESKARGSAPSSSTESDPRARVGCSATRSNGEGVDLDGERWSAWGAQRREIGDGEFKIAGPELVGS